MTKQRIKRGTGWDPSMCLCSCLDCIAGRHCGGANGPCLYPPPDDDIDDEPPARVICPDCGADIPNDGACWYCENRPE